MFKDTADKGSLVTQFMALMFIAWLIPAICLADDWTIAAEGYGPVHAGMSIRQAEKLLNTTLQASGNVEPNPRCDFVYPKHGHDELKGPGSTWKLGEDDGNAKRSPRRYRL